MTKREMFVAIGNVAEVAANEEVKSFIEHQIELLDNRKSSGERKPTAKQKENEGLKEQIKDLLSENRMTCGEIAKALEISSQRCSALLRQLGAEGTKEVVKTMEKKVAYFSLAE